MSSGDSRVVAIIPALNEEQSIRKVLVDLPDSIHQVIVCDTGSTDRTAEFARSDGAQVVFEEEKGYGSACLRAISEAPDDTDILLFVDADYSDFPEEADLLLNPIKEGRADLVVGSRMLTLKEHHALPPVAVFGNWLTSRLIRLLWGVTFTDIGPFRAIRYESYKKLAMRDRNFGWTVEMQVKAIQRGLHMVEVPVHYRRRVGQSKISGTVKGVVFAGIGIISMIFKLALTKPISKVSRPL